MCCRSHQSDQLHGGLADVWGDAQTLTVSSVRPGRRPRAHCAAHRHRRTDLSRARQVTINLDFEGASSDDIYFAPAERLQKGRARAAPGGQRLVAANFQVLNNQNPARESIQFPSRDKRSRFLDGRIRAKRSA